MIQIGNLKLEKNVFLAPLAGVTDLSFRLTCRKYGCPFTYTEMVSAKALYYNDKKTAKLLMSDPEDMPFAVQIFGSDPDIMAQAVPKALATGASLLDINMGCPAPKIVQNGDGSYLMTQPDKITEIVRAVKRVSPVPVSVKIRKGFLEENAVEAALAAEAGGADAICVHGRTRSQYYSGAADWDVITRVKEAVGIPVIGNGDVKTPADAKKMMEKTRCDAVMVGRAALGNPFIFREMDEFFTCGEIKTVTTSKERVEAALWHIERLVMQEGEHMGILQSRKHAAWYIKGMRGSAEGREKINQAKTLAEVRQILQTLLSYDTITLPL